jgi:hypothetical protein
LAVARPPEEVPAGAAEHIAVAEERTVAARIAAEPAVTDTVAPHTAAVEAVGAAEEVGEAERIAAAELVAVVAKPAPTVGPRIPPEAVATETPVAAGALSPLKPPVRRKTGSLSLREEHLVRIADISS